MQAQAVNSKRPSFWEVIFKEVWYNEVENTENRDVIEGKNDVEKHESGYRKRLEQGVTETNIPLDEKDKKDFVEKVNADSKEAAKKAEQVKRQKDIQESQKQGTKEQGRGIEN